MTDLLHIFHEIGQAVGVLFVVAAAVALLKAAFKGLVCVTLVAFAVGFLGIIVAAASFAAADLCNVEIGGSP